LRLPPAGREVGSGAGVVWQAASANARKTLYRVRLMNLTSQRFAARAPDPDGVNAAD